MTEDLLNSIVYQKMGKVDAAIDSTIEEIKRDLLKAESVKQVDAVLKNYATKLPEASLNAMREAGSYYTEIVNQVKSTYQGLGYVLPPIDYSIDTLQAVNTLNSLQYDYLGGRSRLVGGAARQTILDTVLGDQPKRKTARALERILQKKVGERARGYSQTIIRSSASVTGQGVANRVAEAVGVEYWEYEGRIDKNTRPFCYAILKGKDPNSNGPIPYSQESSNFKAWYAGLKKLPMHKGSDGKFYIHISVIRKMDNKQMPNVEVTRGGYNCTHEWLAAPVMVNAELIEQNPELHKAHISGQGQAQQDVQAQPLQQQQTQPTLPEIAIDFTGVETNMMDDLKEYTQKIRPEAQQFINALKKPISITRGTQPQARSLFGSSRVKRGINEFTDSHYRSDIQALNMYYNAEHRTFLHEYGHHIDSTFNRVTRNSDSLLSMAIDAAKARTKASTAKAHKAFAEKYYKTKKIDEETLKNIRRYKPKALDYELDDIKDVRLRGLSDIFDAVSDGRFQQKTGGFGHGYQYYNDKFRQNPKVGETFANMFEAWANVDQTAYNAIKAEFPEIHEAFEATLKQLQLQGQP